MGMALISPITVAGISLNRHINDTDPIIFTLPLVYLCMNSSLNDM